MGSSEPSVGLPGRHTDNGKTNDRTDGQTDGSSSSQAVSLSVAERSVHYAPFCTIFRREKIIRAARSVELDQTISWEYGK